MDPDLVEAFFNKYQAIVHRRALYLLGNRAEAEEATQEVFIRALKDEPEFEHPKQIVAWLNCITTNLCLNHIRDTTRRAKLLREHHKQQTPFFRDTATAEQLVLVRKLLADADESCAAVAVYAIVDGMSYKEIASVLGVTERTVYNRLQRFKDWAAEQMER